MTRSAVARPPTAARTDPSGSARWRSASASRTHRTGGGQHGQQDGAVRRRLAHARPAGPGPRPAGPRRAAPAARPRRGSGRRPRPRGRPRGRGSGPSPRPRAGRAPTQQGRGTAVARRPGDHADHAAGVLVVGEPRFGPAARPRPRLRDADGRRGGQARHPGRCRRPPPPRRRRGRVRASKPGLEAAEGHRHVRDDRRVGIRHGAGVGVTPLGRSTATTSPRSLVGGRASAAAAGRSGPEPPMPDDPVERQVRRGEQGRRDLGGPAGGPVGAVDPGHAVHPPAGGPQGPQPASCARADSSSASTRAPRRAR